MSISSTGLYGSATIVNSDLFNDVEDLKEQVTTLSTSYLQTTQEHREDISENRFDISSNLSKINDLSNNRIKDIEDNITDLSNNRIKDIEDDVKDLSVNRIKDIEDDVFDISSNKDFIRHLQSVDYSTCIASCRTARRRACSATRH